MNGFPGAWFSGRRPCLLLALATLLLWGRTLGHEFVWDDDYFIVRLESIRSLKNVPDMFTSLAAQSSYPKGFVLFRPLRTAHYAVLCALGGGDPPKPWLFHLANVLWHTGVVLLVFALARRLFRGSASPPAPSNGRDLAAFLAALGFAVHPVVAEVVCWAKCLDDLMASAFVLTAACSLLRDKWSRAAWLGAVGWFTLAVYSKESAAPFAALAFLLLWRVRKFTAGRSAALSLAFFGVAALFVLHHHWVVARTSQSAPISGSYGQTLLDMPPVALTYLRLLLGLPPFNIDYSYLKGGHAFFSGPVLLGLVLLLLLALAAWRFLGRERWMPAGVGLAWFGLFLLPVSNLVPMMQYLAERFLYLPMIGWLLALAWCLQALPRPRVVLAVCLVTIFFWASLAWQRAMIWRDRVTLFATTVLQGPPNPRVAENAVFAVLTQPHMRVVFSPVKLPDARMIVSLSPTNAGAVADWPAVFQTLEELTKLLPKEPAVASACGLAHVRHGRPDAAVPQFRRAAELEPNLALHWNNLGLALLDSNRPAEAEAALQKALALDPKDGQALRGLSRLYWQNKDYARARAMFTRLAELEPDNPDHRHWLQRAEAETAAPKAPAPPGPPERRAP